MSNPLSNTPLNIPFGDSFHTPPESPNRSPIKTPTRTSTMRAIRRPATEQKFNLNGVNYSSEDLRNEVVKEEMLTIITNMAERGEDLNFLFSPSCPAYVYDQMGFFMQVCNILIHNFNRHNVSTEVIVTHLNNTIQRKNYYPFNRMLLDLILRNNPQAPFPLHYQGGTQWQSSSTVEFLSDYLGFLAATKEGSIFLVDFLRRQINYNYEDLSTIIKNSILTTPIHTSSKFEFILSFKAEEPATYSYLFLLYLKAVLEKEDKIEHCQSFLNNSRLSSEIILAIITDGVNLDPISRNGMSVIYSTLINDMNLKKIFLTKKITTLNLLQKINTFIEADPANEGTIDLFIGKIYPLLNPIKQKQIIEEINRKFHNLTTYDRVELYNQSTDLANAFSRYIESQEAIFLNLPEQDHEHFNMIMSSIMLEVSDTFSPLQFYSAIRFTKMRNFVQKYFQHFSADLRLGASSLLDQFSNFNRLEINTQIDAAERATPAQKIQRLSTYENSFATVISSSEQQQSSTVPQRNLIKGRISILDQTALNQKRLQMAFLQHLPMHTPKREKIAATFAALLTKINDLKLRHEQELAALDQQESESATSEPIEYLDLITQGPLEDPVLLPDGNIVNRSTIISSKWLNPFNRQELTENDIVPLTIEEAEARIDSNRAPPKRQREESEASSSSSTTTTTTSSSST